LKSARAGGGRGLETRVACCRTGEYTRGLGGSRGGNSQVNMVRSGWLLGAGKAGVWDGQGVRGAGGGRGGGRTATDGRLDHGGGREMIFFCC